ncbi:MAG: hypothetical protein JWN94_1292 [Betaproteobacteria bacterium]|nr:hypothetical protein [Betaproteobacteria bacterium]
MFRYLVAALLMVFTSTALADPILLLLLRMARDKVVTASLEAGVNSLQQPPTMPSPVYGFALPTPAIPRGSEEEQMRSMIDQNFLHLSRSQRDEVFAALQEKLRDPRYDQQRAQLIASFSLTAREVREGYRGLDALSYAEKQSLAVRAGDEYRTMPDSDRHELLEILRSGVLPVPSDLREIMLARFNQIGIEVR